MGKTAVGGHLGQIVSHLQNNQSKMDWRCGSRGRVPALQVPSPEFKPRLKVATHVLQAMAGGFRVQGQPGLVRTPPPKKKV
jgi:hypothetical protein